MLLAEFLSALCATPQAQALTGHSVALAELAYDLTIDKFANLPSDQVASANGKRAGSDCRCYLQSFLDRMAKWKAGNPGADPLREEIAASRTLQRQVVRAFQRSCLEARRSCNPGRSRYAWHVDGRVLYVWVPAWMPGHERRDWLEANVENADPGRPGERRRVQSIIDERLGVPRQVRLDETSRTAASHPVSLPREHSVEGGVSVRGLAQVVAEEKAENLHLQRPAIRALGQPALRDLILRIFGDLGEGRYEEKRLARAFGLSRATLSRFAGSRWHPEPGSQPPDLWVNVAQTLASHQAFAEAAEEAGVWREVEAILEARPCVQEETGR